jgi:hypothetical protein
MRIEAGIPFLVLLPGGVHDTWRRVYGGQDLYDWLRSQLQSHRLDD